MYPRIARMLKVCNVFDIIYSKKLVKICRFQIASPLRNQVCFPHYDMKTVMGVIMRRSNLNFNIPPPPGKRRAFNYFLFPEVGNLTGKAFPGVGNLTLPGWGGEN